MSNLQTPCPQCFATLELPETAIGKQARCPSCEFVFHVPDPSQGRSASAASTAGFEPAPTAAATSSTQPSDPSNPYAPTSQLEASGPRAVDPVNIRTISIDTCLSITRAMFTDQWQTLVGLGALIFVVNILGSLAQQVGNVAAQATDEPAWGLVAIPVQLVFNLIRFYLTLGLTRVSLDLARGRTVTFRDAFTVGPWLVVKAVLGYLLIFAPASVLMLVAIAVGFALGEDTGFIVLISAFFAFLPIILLLWLFTWPFLQLLVDREKGVLETIRLAFNVAKVNKVNAVIIWLVVTGINILGICLFCVGQVAALPASTLLVSVAVLMMTGQRIYTPALTNYVPPTDAGNASLPPVPPTS